MSRRRRRCRQRGLVKKSGGKSPEEKSPEENISYTTQKAPAAPFVLTNFILYAL